MTTIESERESNYTVVALLVAPLVAAVGLPLWGFVSDGGLTESFASVIAWTFIFYWYALVATVIIGLPCFLLLRKIRLVKWWSSLASGFLVGLLVLLAIDPNAASTRPNDIGVWGGIGGISAFVFWLVRLYGQRKLSKSTTVESPRVL
jgi:hypothetical protein